MSETYIGTTGREAGVTAVSAFFERWKRRAAMSTPSARDSSLARVSLFGIVATCAVGCVDSPPQYTEPARIPPVIVMDQVQPSPTSIYITPTHQVQFDIPFRADDAGRKLVARFVLDIEIGAPESVKQVNIAPDPMGRPFAEQGLDRVVDYKWPWNDSNAGCHTMTAIISDVNNFTDIGGVTSDDLDEARVTWFLWLQNGSDPVPTVNLLQNNMTGTNQ
jgi:hypothetical protein